MKRSDIGIIIGRFQVASLSEGHRELIEYVISENTSVIIILGESLVKVTKHNPLSFESRRLMIAQEYPDALILSLKDCKTDIEWSKNLDTLISENTPPYARKTLYGSRNSFLDLYDGKYKIERTEQQNNSISGTDHRTQISCKINNSEQFRQGVIWATQNKYNQIQMMVDIAPIIEIENIPHLILINKKSDGNLIRFIGGHVEPPKNSYGPNTRFALEKQAIKECKEESNLDIDSPDNVTYLGSFLINDWRYQNEDKVITAFFVAKAIGIPRADDDADEVLTISIKDFVNFKYATIVEEHNELALRLREYLIYTYKL